MALRKPTIVAALLTAALAASAADKIVWKPILEAMLKIDEKPVRLWNVYREDKDKKLRRLLLELGSRYLRFDTENREVAEYDPAVFERHGKELKLSRAAKPQRVLPTSEWVLRDAGTVWIIHARLTTEGRVVEIQLPKLPDLRPFY